VRLYADLADISKANARDVRGQPIIPSALIVTTMFAAATLVGALPNGRKLGEAMCDGCLNPHANFDTADSWSRLRSALKIDQVKGRAWIYNQKLDYGAISGENGLNKLTEFVEAAMLSGQEQMQFNILGREQLEAAKRDPEKHKNLSVRISGYSAYFTTLPEFVQDAVIARVEHKL
jgi:pyruvate-formate lyase